MGIFEELAKLVSEKKLTPEQFGKLCEIAGKIQPLSQQFDTTSIRELSKRMLSQRSRNMNIIAASQLARLAEKKYQFYSSEDLMSELPIFKDYPFVLLDTFFSHPNEVDVTFKSTGQRRDLREKLPIALSNMLPSCFTSRYYQPYKILCGTLTQLGGDIFVTSDLDNFVDCEPVAEVKENRLPPEFPRELIKLPADTRTLKVLKPINMKYSTIPNWRRTAPGVTVCTTCSRVPDGDELGPLRGSRPYCPECRSEKPNLSSTQTVPESFAKSWYEVTCTNLRSPSQNTMTVQDAKVSPEFIATLPYFTSNMFSSIGFSEDYHVTHFYYAVQRSYVSTKVATNPITIFFRFRGRPVAFGDKVHTDGFLLKINNELRDKYVNEVVKEPVAKVILIQFLYDKIRSVLGRQIGYFGCIRVFRALLRKVLDDNAYTIPTDLEILRSEIKGVLNDSDELSKRLSVDYPALNDRQLTLLLTSVRDNSEAICSFTKSDLEHFVGELLTHSLAHLTLDSVQEVSGSSEHDTGYFFDAEKGEIFVFDSTEGGGGFCECAMQYFFIPFSYRNARIRQRLGRFDTTPTFLPTHDTITIFEQALAECPDYLTYRILFEVAKLLSLDDIANLMDDENKRAGFVRDIVATNSNLLMEQLSLIDYNLRNGLMVLFKTLQEKLSIQSYDDLFALSIVPDCVQDRLEELGEQHQVQKILRHDTHERRVDDIKDLLTLCYSTCPTCSLPSRCVDGTLETVYRVNQRILYGWYKFAIENQTVIVAGSNLEQSVADTQSILLKHKSAYVELDENASFDVIYRLLGVRDGTEYRIKVIDEEDEDTIYPSVNFKSIQYYPVFEEIAKVNHQIKIPQRLLVKLELS